jgi:dTDP-4-dehydrorhamnose 3,5-epimerase
MEIIPAGLDGLKILRPKVFTDLRGIFVKTFHQPSFQAAGLDFASAEEFFSISHKGVLRGMHFQLPPHCQTRLVTCLAGKILDVVLDLRHGSPSFGRFWSGQLDTNTRDILFIPEGFAHGFLALENNTLVSYVASRPHSPEHDFGLHWNSFGFNWPVKNLIISERDQKFPALSDFASPFRVGCANS